MLTQRLVQDMGSNSGTLTITAAAGNLADLASLAEELNLRMNIKTEGTITTNPPAPPPTMEDEG